MQIGFCGLGRMGAAMVSRLLDQGRQPIVWNRNPDKAKPLVTKGARAAPTPAAVAAQSDIVQRTRMDAAAGPASGSGCGITEPGSGNREGPPGTWPALSELQSSSSRSETRCAGRPPA
ncbi:MAG: NAD(P)-binding domain-containing protein [Alphaproteobacteria bacterium]|nr:NAD(P)-binding domain-containing protein [Alphaproteobacteria bacterium]